MNNAPLPVLVSVARKVRGRQTSKSSRKRRRPASSEDDEVVPVEVKNAIE